MTINIDEYLSRASQVILPIEQIEQVKLDHPDLNKLSVGVDLGTAYIVLVVLDENNLPLIGTYQFAQVVRDGLVVDYIGAVDILRRMKEKVEQILGCRLESAASGFPPGVPQAEVRATANVVEAAGFSCSGLVDEPSAANHLLKLKEGAVVDVGGGTTGIAIIRDGQVVYTADEATGGTHFSLVISGSLDISFEEAETLKKTASEQSRLFPLVRPVMEKVASITSKHLKDQPVSQIYLVGGSSAFPGMAKVVEEYCGIPTKIPPHPLLVTPIGIAIENSICTDER